MLYLLLLKNPVCAKIFLKSIILQFKKSYERKSQKIGEELTTV